MTLDADDLAAMRATQEDALPNEAIIEDVSTARSAGGGLSETWTPRATPTRCRVSPATSRQVALVADRLKGNDAAVVTFPARTDIEFHDKITMADGREFLVLAVLDREAWETARQVIVTVVP